MMHKLATLIVLALVCTTSAAAAENTVTMDVGSIAPGSIFYPLDPAFDALMIEVGFTTPAAVAQERAAEVLYAQEIGANTTDIKQRLYDAQQRIPDDERDAALASIEEAFNRANINMPEPLQARGR